MQRVMSVLSWIAVIALVSVSVASAAPISYTGGTYQQNFDSLINGPSDGSTATWTDGTTVPGWYASVSLFTDGNYLAANGSADHRGEVLSAGSIGGGGTNPDSDRALGVQGYNSVDNFQILGVAFSNATGGSVSSVNITYDGEQWRYRDEDGDDLVVEYQVFSGGSGSLADGVWTAIPAITFVAPVTGSIQNTQYDGNDPAYRVAGLAATLDGLSWGVGEELWIRWVDNGPAEHIMAVDDFSLSLPAAAGTVVTIK